MSAAESVTNKSSQCWHPTTTQSNIGFLIGLILLAGSITSFVLAGKYQLHKMKFIILGSSLGGASLIISLFSCFGRINRSSRDEIPDGPIVELGHSPPMTEEEFRNVRPAPIPGRDEPRYI